MTAFESETYLKITFSDASYQEKEKLNYIVDGNRILPYADSGIYYTTLCKAKRLTKGEDVKAVYDIALDIKGIRRNFQPGDTIAILPKNDKTEVQQLLNRLNLLDVVNKTYTLEMLNGTTRTKTSIPNHIPSSSTLYELFSKHIDIRTIPKKIFLRMLMKYTKCEEESNKLLHLTSKEGSQDYFNFIKAHGSLLAVLLTFPSCLPPIEKLLETLPPLQPRIYSISSSPFLETELHITFSVIETNYNAKGICSGWLENVIKQFQSQAKHSEVIPFYFRKTNNFRLPANVSLPILMIGPGTGIAPFFGFLQHRELQVKQHNIKFGSSWLFYGCRYSNRDFLYKDEIEQMLEDGILTQLFTCYSREGSAKRYVQDVIKENAKEIVDQIVTQNATVYVCGDAKGMMVDVRKALAWCLEKIRNMSSTDAEIYIKGLEKSGRYIRDIWL